VQPVLIFKIEDVANQPLTLLLLINIAEKPVFISALEGVAGGLWRQYNQHRQKQHPSITLQKAPIQQANKQ
jgi:hypothetical protein